MRIGLALLALLLLLGPASAAPPVPALRADAYLSSSTVAPGEALAYSVVVSDSVDEAVTFAVAVSYDAAKLRAGQVVRFPRSMPCAGASCSGSFGERADVGKDRVFTFLFAPTPGACGTVQPFVAEVHGGLTIRLVSEEVEIVCAQHLPIVTQ